MKMIHYPDKIRTHLVTIKITIGRCKFMRLTIVSCVVSPYIDSIVNYLLVVSHSFNLDVTLLIINLQHIIV